MCDVKVSLTFTSLSLVLLLTTVLPVLFKYCYTYCYSDSRKLWAVMKGGGLAFKIWFNPPFLLKCLYQIRVITVFTVFRLLTDFVCLYTYEFWLSLCKIARSSVILLLPLFSLIRHKKVAIFFPTLYMPCTYECFSYIWLYKVNT